MSVSTGCRVFVHFMRNVGACFTLRILAKKYASELSSLITVNKNCCYRWRKIHFFANVIVDEANVA